MGKGGNGAVVAGSEVGVGRVTRRSTVQLAQLATVDQGEAALVVRGSGVTGHGGLSAVADEVNDAIDTIKANVSSLSSI